MTTVLRVMPDRVEQTEDERADIVAHARAEDRLVVVDEARDVVAVSLDAAARRQAVIDRIAPNFSLPDLNGSMHQFSEWSGTKRLLLAWSSW